MINKIIRNFIAKQIAGRSDDGIMITLKDPQRVTLGENIMADLLLRNGIDPRAITSEAQLKTILQQIENAQAAAIRNTGIRNTESAKVFDLKGKEIKNTDNIIGGKELTDSPLDDLKSIVDDYKPMGDEPPPGSRGGADDIAAPVQSAEETLKNMIQAENKKNIAKMKQKKMLDEAIDNVSPSLSGDRKVDAELVAEDLAERMGLVYDDMPTKERLKLYDEAYQGLTKKKFDPPEDMAEGGIARIGLKEGSGMSRRTFLKLLGGVASIPIVGKIFKPLKVGKTVTKVPIIKTDNVPGKPEWFDSLVNKVILEGDDVTKKLATVEREIVHTKKINDTDQVTVYQDLNTDSVRVEYRSPDNMMEEPVDLSYKRTPPDEGAPRGDVEFEATEMGYVGRADGPDDYFIDAEEVGGRSIKALDSDVSALKEYATGQKPTMKEIVQKKKRKDKVKKLNEGDLEAQSDYIIDRQGDYVDYDDYASGGIAKMLGE